MSESNTGGDEQGDRRGEGGAAGGLEERSRAADGGHADVHGGDVGAGIDLLVGRCVLVRGNRLRLSVFASKTPV